MPVTYHSLADPAGLIRPSLVPHWPAEPALGGWYGEAELEAAIQAIRSSLDMRVGFKAQLEVEAFESEFCAYTGAKCAVACNGAGAALDLLLRALDIGPGDEVASCALNFHGDHLAVLDTGASSLLCEPDPHTLNLDPADLAARITPRTRLILATSLHGLAPDMDAIWRVAAEHRRVQPGLKVVVDASRSLGATHGGRHEGQHGDATLFSLQSKKHITALGEGGVVATDDPVLAETLRRSRSFGHGVAWGSNFKMTKPQAAVARVQLRRLDEMNQVRIQLAEARNRRLGALTGCTLPSASVGARHVYYVYPIILPADWNRRRRDQLIARLAEEHGLGCVVANPPTYEYNSWIADHTLQRLPFAEAISSRLICPSFHPLYTAAEESRIADAFLTAFHEV